MKTCSKAYLLVLAFTFILSGCIVRTYPLNKDRVDQDLSTGNRGYLKGSNPSEEVKERKTTRRTQVVEIELRSPIKFEKMPERTSASASAVAGSMEGQEVMGNKGYITQSETPEVLEPNTGNTEKYKVQKGDTLQKISKKFYGTTKKWNKIYDANRGILKGPNKLYPGQTIDVPVEGLKETKENLK
ncbi:MAG: LysM peptidoglycan-binding domain-containing protein [Candidatus Omnitrophica bacterium]|nr:LysM peptidoglycan-binding domain-containing protein [Candidatus Omnitrophota bacterium]